jgi:hypothetical protein
MDFASFNQSREQLHTAVAASTVAIFPLEHSLSQAKATHGERAALVSAAGVAPGKVDTAAELLAVLHSTSVSAALAVKRVSERKVEVAGISTALVDLWGMAEAGTALWYDTFVRFPGDQESGREPALRETVRLLGPEAVSIATQLHEPVVQYIEFVSKVAY